MAVTQVAAATRVTGTTSIALAYAAGYTPASGDLLLLFVDANTANGTAASFTDPSSAVWTKLGTISGVNSLQTISGRVYARWADGTTNDNAPTIAASGVSSGQGVTEAWRGLDSTTALPVQPTAPFTGTTGTSGTTVTGNSLTTSVANEFVWSAMSARFSSAVTAISWTGGSADDLVAAKSGTCWIGTGTQTVATSGTVVTPGGSTTGTGSGSVSGIMSFGFKPAAAGTPITGTGSITLGGSGTAKAAVHGTNGITLGGSGTAKAAVHGTGSISLSGTATTKAAVHGTNAFSLNGTGTAKAAIHGTGAISLNGSGSLKARMAGTGAFTLGGTGTLSGGAPHPITGTGSIALNGTGSLKARLAGAGLVSLSGSGLLKARLSAAGLLSLSGTGVVTPPTTPGFLSTQTSASNQLTVGVDDAPVISSSGTISASITSTSSSPDLIVGYPS